VRSERAGPESYGCSHGPSAPFRLDFDRIADLAFPEGLDQVHESDEGPTAPERIERGHLEIAEGWHRAGDMYWVSEVTVDGVPMRMTFEIYHVMRTDITRDARIFSGFRAMGAFVYPRGQTIVHDPGMSAAAVYAGLPEPTNLASSFLVGLQLAVVGVALIPAILLRRRSRRGSR